MKDPFYEKLESETAKTIFGIKPKIRNGLTER